MCKKLKIMLLFVYVTITVMLSSRTVMARYDGTADSIYLGRLTLKIGGVETVKDLPLYYVENGLSGEIAQQVVDWENSGIYLDYSNGFNRIVSPLIGDHKHQGFDCLWDCEPGDTCSIRYADGTEEHFVCREVDRDGVNNETDVLDSNGNIAVLKHPTWLCTYTCNQEGWWTVTIAWWQNTDDIVDSEALF